MRIAFLTNAPAPYRTPVFEHIASADGVEARVFFDSASGAAVVDRQPGYPHESLRPAFNLRHRNYQDDAGWAEQVSMGFALGYLPRLAAFRPDVIVSGEFGWRTLNATVYARAAGIPILVWWEGRSDTARGGRSRALRRDCWVSAKGALIICEKLPARGNPFTPSHRLSTMNRSPKRRIAGARNANVCASSCEHAASRCSA